MDFRPTLALLAVIAAVSGAARAQEEVIRRWVVDERATLRAPDPKLDAFCKEAIPVEAANGLSAPNTPDKFTPWLAHLKTQKPEIAKCYDPGPPIKMGSVVTLFDSNEGCGGASIRVRLDDNRVGCVYADYLSNKPPQKK